MHVRLQYVPEGLDHVIVGGLRPNYNYTCTIGERVQEGAQVFNGKLSKPVVFCTDYAGIANINQICCSAHFKDTQ